MPVFPSLSTGSVTQYPTVLATGQSTQVIRFLDGSDQRCRLQGHQLRQWQIRLDLLNEDEVSELESFFQTLAGDFSTFIFPDPITGSDVPNCRLASPGLTSAYLGVDVGSVSFVVVETNG